MRGIPSLSQIAKAVWTMVAVASRTVTVSVNSDKTGYTLSTNTDKAGYTISTNTDKAGYSGAVSDKAGYSLTAGSYVVRASSVTSSTIAVSGTSNTGAISVTATRAYSNIGGAKHSGGSGSKQALLRARVTSGSAVTATKFTTDGTSTLAFEVIEFF